MVLELALHLHLAFRPENGNKPVRNALAKTRVAIPVCSDCCTGMSQNPAGN